MPISVLIVDDNEVLRDTLRRMLDSFDDLQVVAEAGDGAAAIALAEKHKPNVAVLDIGMKGMTGIEAARRILGISPRTAVLMLTVYNIEPYVVRSLQAGARGYLLKESLDPDELAEAIRTVSRGGYYFSSAVRSALPDHAVPTPVSS